MKFSEIQSLASIAELLQCDYVGPPDFPVSGFNEIHVVTSGDIVFVDHPKYYDKALACAASVVLINKRVDCPQGKALLISEDPFAGFNKLKEHFRPFERANNLCSDTAVIGKGTVIQPGVFVGNHVTIGEDCLIHPNVIIYDHTIIGDRVTVHSGTVLGADAFYYKNRPEAYDQLKSSGRVVVQNDVHLGALCTIDRGVSGDTIIGAGTKIDNQVHVGHDTSIGSKCLIAAQTGIAGCVVIQDQVTIWGQVGITSAITIGKGAVIYAQSGVSKSLEGNKTYYGTPAEEFRKKYKEMAAIRQIPELMDQLKKMK